MNKSENNHSRGLNLDEIARRREELKQAISTQWGEVETSYHHLLEPFTGSKAASGNVGGRLLSGLTLVQGIVWGVRFIARLHRIFHRAK